MRIIKLKHLFRGKHWAAILIILIFTIFVNCNHQLPPDEDLKFTIQTRGATVVQSVSGNTMTVDIRSQTGIGETTLIKDKGSWPNVLEVHLHIQGMERLQLITADIEATLAINSTSPHRLRGQMKRNGVELTQQRSDKILEKFDLSIVNPDGRQPLVIPVTSGWIQFTMPQEFLKSSSDSLTISWIDFYR